MSSNRMVTAARVVRTLAGAAAVVIGAASSAHAQSASTRDRASTDPRIVEAGGKLYRRNCAVCHGWRGEGTVANWNQPGPDGKMPPPPLNGTAHTWHHPRSGLMLVIRQGTVRIGGNMPAWKDRLNDAQISAIIDHLISLWPEDVYQAWLKRGGYN